MTKQQRTIQSLSRLEVIQPGSGNHPVDFGCVPFIIRSEISGEGFRAYKPNENLIGSALRKAKTYMRDINQYGFDLDFEWTGTMGEQDKLCKECGNSFAMLPGSALIN